METFKININGIYRGDLHTIEDVAHLIAGASPFDNLMITDIADVKLVSTIGNFLNHVSDKELLRLLHHLLIPLQMGEKKIREVNLV